jgi:hypothetical protein
MPERQAVGHRGGAGRYVEAERESRLVARVVVGGEDVVLPVRWPAVAEPSAWMKNAVDAVSSPGSVGTATKWLTRTTNSPFLRSGRRGVITSSSPSRRQPARAPSTVTRSRLLPEKSRSKRESDCLARAKIVTVPPIGCDGARVA